MSFPAFRVKPWLPSSPEQYSNSRHFPHAHLSPDISTEIKQQPTHPRQRRGIPTVSLGIQNSSTQISPHKSTVSLSPSFTVLVGILNSSKSSIVIFGAQDPLLLPLPVNCVVNPSQFHAFILLIFIYS